jgi:hypothetical protein
MSANSLVANPTLSPKEKRDFKLWKRRPPKLNHTQYLTGLRRLRLYEQWKKRYLYFKEVTSYVRTAMVLDWLGLGDFLTQKVLYLHRLVRKWKQRLRFFGSKPDYRHLSGIYRKAMSVVFGPLVKRVAVSNDSAIFGDVAKCTYHQASCPGYQPMVLGVPLWRIASISRDAP